jgi:TonB family protein
VGTLDRLTNNINPGVRNNIRRQVILGGSDTSRLIHAGVESGATVGPTDVFTPSRLVAKQAGTQRPLEAEEPGQLLSAPAPLYSQEARSLNLTGEVLLEVKLMSSGEVRVLKVLSGLGHGLDQEAIEAVNRTRCLPARRGGRAVDVVATITVVFKLS